MAERGLTLDEVEERLGEPLFDHQTEAATVWMRQSGPSPRLCLYFRTGSGKTTSALMLLALRGVREALVIAPPSTHPAWRLQGEKLGIEVIPISHTIFRAKGYLVSRGRAVIVDEFHMLGGHTGQGWKKLDRLAGGMQAPLILLSATPNYNDAERVYCIEHVLAPQRVRGGFLQFLYTNCETEANPYAAAPVVTGFRHHKDAAEYLASLPEVCYLPDNVTVQIEDKLIPSMLPPLFDDYGIDIVRGRIMASQMEAKHRQWYYERVDADGVVHPKIIAALEDIVDNSATPVLVYCMSSEIACALGDTLRERDAEVAVVTGKDTATRKNAVLDQFRKGDLPLLIGTATLATGTDGLDKVCDTLVILHDTEDASARRQLIGRILPRGKDTDASKKRVVRFVTYS